MARLFNDRIDMHTRELRAFGLADRNVPEFVQAYADTYRGEVERMFRKMRPDDEDGRPGEINADRLKRIAWQHDKFAWNRMRSALNSGFGSMQGMVHARAEAWAHQEIAANFWALSEGRWLPDMGGRIPNR